MILEHLYRLSLEHPKFWPMFIGLPVNPMYSQEVRIDMLGSYIHGLRESCPLAGIERTDLDDFFIWLRDVRKEFPSEGWVTKYFNDCDSDHTQAIGKFWSMLYEYLCLEKPDWFIQVNAAPIASQIQNLHGESEDTDLRRPSHIEAAVALQ